jgi:hypothetical protein
MAIPNLPVFFDMSYTDDKGDLTPDAFFYNDSMFQSLNVAVFLLNSIVSSLVESDGRITNQGLFAPQKTTSEITAFGANSTVPNGAIYFDTDDSKLKVKTADSTIETITST